MESSTALICEVDRRLMWGAVLWFLGGIAGAVGNWFNIDALKADKLSVLWWLVFGGLIFLGEVVLDCAKAVLAAIEENAQADDSALLESK